MTDLESVSEAAPLPNFQQFIKLSSDTGAETVVSENCLLSPSLSELTELKEEVSITLQESIALQDEKLHDETLNYDDDENFDNDNDDGEDDEADVNQGGRSSRG
jgi:hypothetical protein